MIRPPFPLPFPLRNCFLINVKKACWVANKMIKYAFLDVADAVDGVAGAAAAAESY